MISAVILTHNEEKNIESCIRTLRWCDEIIVVDDNSKDKTVAIAEKLGAKVFTHALENNFSKQRNFALSQAKGEWVLFVDADERVSDSLTYEIGNVLHSQVANTCDAFLLQRVDTMWGQQLKHGENGNVRLIRLAKKTAGEWKGAVHEVWHIKGRVKDLKNPLYHYPHQTITEFLKEINYYTTIRAEELFKKRKRVYFWSIIFYPKAKFFYNFIIRQGFLDGTAGFVVALCMSFHSFLVRGKLWQLWQAK